MRRLTQSTVTKDELEKLCSILGHCLTFPCDHVINSIPQSNYMLQKDPEWCSQNCRKGSAAACWKKYLELKIEDESVQII